MGGSRGEGRVYLPRRTQEDLSSRGILRAQTEAPEGCGRTLEEVLIYSVFLRLRLHRPALTENKVMPFAWVGWFIWFLIEGEYWEA